MRISNIKLSIFLIIVLFVGVTQHAHSQSIKDITIKEYYWGTPLSKVLDDLQSKYGIKIEYDSTVVAKYTFDDKGRFYSGTTVERAFYAICQDIAELSFYIDENEVVHLQTGAVPRGMGYDLSMTVPDDVEDKTITIATEEIVINNKYEGEPTRSDITISGIIKDKDTGETLSYAAVVVDGTSNGATSNVDGYFTLFDVPSDTARIIISYIGYHMGIYFLTPETDLSSIEIQLQSRSSTLEEVVVSAGKEELMQTTDKVGVVKMSPKLISELPMIGEKDIFRSFQLLPGVSGSNESSSGLFVLGGTPDQNLVLYDGFTVYHVDHLFGMFSAFNSNAVKDVQLHKGGFESQFGGRISSVMEIVGKDGNEKHFNIGGDIGLLSANIYTEIPIAKKLTLLMAARRSWKSFIYNDIFDSFNEASDDVTTSPPVGSSGRGGGRGMKSNENTTPSSYFYDLNAKLTYKPTKKDMISYSFFNGKDDLDNSREINRSRNGMTISGGTTDVTEWGNWGMSTTWSRKWSNKYYSNALISVSDYFSNRDLAMSRVTNTTIREQSSIEDNNLRDYTFKFNNELKLNNANQLEFGVQVTHLTVDYDYVINDTTIVQQRNDKGLVSAVFLQDRVKLFDNLTLVPGMRVSYYDVTEKTYFEPRASVKYNLNSRISFKGAWGHYYQFANRIIRTDISSGSKDFWVLGDGDVVPVSYAEHFILGASYETKDYLFDVEGYYKNLDGLSEYSLQFARSFNNVDYNEFFYKGTGVAKGIQFLIQKKYGRYNGWISYTLGEVLYNFPIYGEQSFYASHDVTNEFKIVNTFKLNKWTFAGTWIYGTGKPYTEPTGEYSVEMLDGNSQSFMEIGEKNAARYPDYHRLDLSATFNYKLGNTGFGSIAFSIFNVYNRTNVWYKEFEVDESELIETDVTLLGITPSITLSFRLR